MNGANVFISATEARNNFFELLEKVKRGPYPINITIKGVPQVVIMNKEDYDAWMATLETLSDPELMRSLKQSEKDLKSGRYSSLEAVKQELGIKEHVSRKSSSLSPKRSKKA